MAVPMKLSQLPLDSRGVRAPGGANKEIHLTCGVALFPKFSIGWKVLAFANIFLPPQDR